MSQTQAVNVADIAPLVNRDRVTEILRELVRIPSENPPGNELEVARLVQEYCEQAGLEVVVHEVERNRPNVIARLRAGDGPTVAFCTHLDVVPAGDLASWVHAPFDAHIGDGRLHGRGASDAKGPLAAALEAVVALRALGAELVGTLELVLVSDEEAMGFKGAGHLVAEKLVRPDLAIVGEPTSLRVVHAQRGAYWFEITTHGRAAHGSAPERGASAIRHMAEIIVHLEETLPKMSHRVLGGPSINVGTIRGGSKVNIVPARCTIEVDRRTIPGESPEQVEASIAAAVDLARESFPDLDATVNLALSAQPFEVAEDSRIVTEVTRAAAEVSGAAAELMGFRGASDARFLAEAGAEVVVCGPGQIELAHTSDESIDLEELERGARLYALAFARLLAPPH
ncbi:MAG TPA: M20 family metallopeptidase [Actinomycetota bacterium]|nr:M20 family metallopeptidase [Actinomycetota bacterium]